MKKIEDCSYEKLLKHKKTNQIAATTLTSILSFLVVALKNPFIMPSIWFTLKSYDFTKRKIEKTMAETDEDIKLLYDIYKEILENTYKTISSLDASNSMDIYSYFCSMFNYGCFSYDLNTNHPLDMSVLKSNTFGETLVLNGHGVCRHLAVFLQRVYTKLGYESDVVVGHSNRINLNELSDYVEFCKKQPSLTSEEIKKILITEHLNLGKFASKNYERKQKFSNHAITRVNCDGTTLILDPMNDCVMCSVIEDIFYCPASEESLVFVLDGELSSKYNKSYNIQMIKEYECLEPIHMILSYFASNIKASQAYDVFEKFHKDNLPALEEAENLTQKVLQKKY